MSHYFTYKYLHHMTGYTWYNWTVISKMKQ